MKSIAKWVSSLFDKPTPLPVVPKRVSPPKLAVKKKRRKKNTVRDQPRGPIVWPKEFTFEQLAKTNPRYSKQELKQAVISAVSKQKRAVFL